MHNAKHSETHQHCNAADAAPILPVPASQAFIDVCSDSLGRPICNECSGAGNCYGILCEDCAGTGARPAFVFHLSLLNDDGTVAIDIATNDLRLDRMGDLQTFVRAAHDYVREGYDGIGAQSERDPADYR